MQVSKEILTQWNENLDQGDKEKIAEHLGVTPKTISKAFAGEATQNTILQITDFFIQKNQRIMDAQKKLNKLLSENKA